MLERKWVRNPRHRKYAPGEEEEDVRNDEAESEETEDESESQQSEEGDG